MSWEATNWAVKQMAGSPGAKIVLLLLADRADDRHSCWPSQERLAEESEQSVATVRRRLRDLESVGLIWTERRNIPGLKRATNRYVLAVASTAQTDTQTVSTAQTDDLPLNLDDVYRSAVSAEPSLEPSITEPPVRTTPDDNFGEFWKAYPRKKDKGHARKAWDKAAKNTDPAVLIHAAVQFRQWCEQDGTEPQFVPHASTWLNGERWNDERDPTPVSATEKRMDGHMALIKELWDNENGSQTRKPFELEG